MRDRVDDDSITKLPPTKPPRFTNDAPDRGARKERDIPNSPRRKNDKKERQLVAQIAMRDEVEAAKGCDRQVTKGKSTRSFKKMTAGEVASDHTTNKKKKQSKVLLSELKSLYYGTATNG